MLIEVEHQASVVFSFNAGDEAAVDQIKETIGKHVHVSVANLTLAHDGVLLENGHKLSEYLSGDRCRLMMFLRKGERPTTNIEVDLAHGKTVLVAVYLDWTVRKLKEELKQELDGQSFTNSEMLTFGRYILEDDRTLEQYKIKEGSRITVFGFLQSREPTHLFLPAPLQLPQPIPTNGHSMARETNHEVIPCTDSPTSDAHDTPHVQTIPPTLNAYPSTKEDMLAHSYVPEDEKEPTSPSTVMHQRPELAASQQIQETEHMQSASTEFSSPICLASPRGADKLAQQTTLSGTDLPSSKEAGSFPSLLSSDYEPKTITIPGGVFQRRKSSTKKRFDGPAIPVACLNSEHMCITFTDGSRQRMVLELPQDITVSRATEALRDALPGEKQGSILLFRGVVEMDRHRQLKSYGIIHGTSVIFKRQMRVHPR